MSRIARFIIQLLFIALFGLIFIVAKDQIDSSLYYLCGFIVGFFGKAIF